MIRGSFYLRAQCIEGSGIVHAPPDIREDLSWNVGYRRGPLLEVGLPEGHHNEIVYAEAEGKSVRWYSADPIERKVNDIVRIELQKEERLHAKDNGMRSMVR